MTQTTKSPKVSTLKIRNLIEGAVSARIKVEVRTRETFYGNKFSEVEIYLGRHLGRYSRQSYEEIIKAGNTLANHGYSVRAKPGTVYRFFVTSDPEPLQEWHIREGWMIWNENDFRIAAQLVEDEIKKALDEEAKHKQAEAERWEKARLERLDKVEALNPNGFNVQKLYEASEPRYGYDEENPQQVAVISASASAQEGDKSYSVFMLIKVTESTRWNSKQEPENALDLHITSIATGRGSGGSTSVNGVDTVENGIREYLATWHVG